MSVLVLLSGGVDSIVMAQRAIGDHTLWGTLHVRYKHPAWCNEVAAVAAAHREWSRQGLQVVALTVEAELYGLTSMWAGIGQSGPRVVPARNLSMVATAINAAAAHHVDEVWIGCTAEDQQDYVDCSAGFIEKVNQIGQLFGVSVRAPLIDMTRDQIEKLGRELSAPLWCAWSCYQPTINGKPCGTCNSCRQGTVLD